MSDIAIREETTNLPILPKLDARIPVWSLDKLAFRRCPLCSGENQPVLLRPDRLPVAYCGLCGLWYVSGLPPLDEIDKLYQNYWYVHRAIEFSPSLAESLQANAKSWEHDVSMNRLSALGGGLEGKRILEIGCGCGEFLVGARHRGALVFGNDISEEACGFVRAQLDIPVYEGPLADSAFLHQFGHMDMVVTRDLIEHPVDPLNAFETALNILRPGGLMLIYTPNGGGASDTLVSASEWVGFRKDLEHLQYLSPKTILCLAGRYRCDLEHLETFEYPFVVDRVPVPPAARRVIAPSWEERAKAKLRKSGLARRIVHAVRILRNAPQKHIPDVRGGTYSLLAILRKGSSPNSEMRRPDLSESVDRTCGK